MCEGHHSRLLKGLLQFTAVPHWQQEVTAPIYVTDSMVNATGAVVFTIAVVTFITFT